MLLPGVLPFGAAFIESVFILSSVWQGMFFVLTWTTAPHVHTHLSTGRVYYVFGFLALVFVILIVTCAEATIVMIYFQLTREDYNWWWRSFLTSGSYGVWLYLYCIFYYFTALDIQNFASSVLYFGYMFMVCVPFPHAVPYSFTHTHTHPYRCRTSSASSPVSSGSLPLLSSCGRSTRRLRLTKETIYFSTHPYSLLETLTLLSDPAQIQPTHTTHPPSTCCKRDSLLAPPGKQLSIYIIINEHTKRKKKKNNNQNTSVRHPTPCSNVPTRLRTPHTHTHTRACLRRAPFVKE